jgi:fucose 4-O-acetylase-like acetyltransferase
MQQRSAAIDLIRVLAMIAVVAGHVWASEPVVRSLVYSWHVPVFFFLTGYLWKSGRSVADEARSRARSLLLPYAAWTVIIGSCLLVYVTVVDGFPLEGVARTLWGGTLSRGLFTAFWFLPVLFFVAVYLRYMERHPRWLAWALAAVGVAAFSTAGEQLALAPQGLLTTLPASLFVLAGQELRRREGRIPAPAVCSVGVLGGAVLLLLAGVVQPLDLKAGTLGTPIVSMLLSCGICAALVTLANALLGRWRAGAGLVTELATTSVAVLLTQTVAIATLGALTPSRGLVLAGTLAATWGLGVVLHRTPLSLPLLGVTRRLSPARRPTHAR